MANTQRHRDPQNRSGGIPVRRDPERTRQPQAAQDGASLERSEPRGFLDPAPRENEEYGTAGPGPILRSGAASTTDDEDSAFSGYDLEAPEAGRKLDGRRRN